MTASRLAALLILVLPIPALAVPCPVPGQKPMLLVKMYFGQVPVDVWDQFLSGTITPGFPDGLTVYSARGQWMDPKTHRLTHEESRVVEIAAPDTQATRNRIVAIAARYRQVFHQQSVGIVTSPACALF